MDEKIISRDWSREKLADYASKFYNMFTLFCCGKVDKMNWQFAYFLYGYKDRECCFLL